MLKGPMLVRRTVFILTSSLGQVDGASRSRRILENEGHLNLGFGAILFVPRIFEKEALCAVFF